MRAENAQYAFVGALIEDLVRSGVRHVSLCPGSRSAPLAIACARQPGLRSWLHIDERSAAFFALGMAKASREPVALLATSGTATVNFAPAVVEASYARVPLIVLTADRPHELRDCGAPQTIDQVRLYGEHVRWAADLAPAAADESMLRYARTTACRAVAVARLAPAGPVQLNVPLRQPLVPLADGWSPDDALDPTTPAPANGRGGDGRPSVERPLVRAASVRRAPAPHEVERLAAALRPARRGLIVCGPLDDPAFPPALAALAAALDWPVIADGLSGLRFGPHDRGRIVRAADALLRAEDHWSDLAPDAVLRFGATPTSKTLGRFLERHRAALQVVIDDAPLWQDPFSSATEVLQADATTTCEALAGALASAPRRGGGASGWTRWWIDAGARVAAALDAHLDSAGPFFEGRIAAELAALAPAGTIIVAGNSMPVRDLDSFALGRPEPLRVLANRGANGIDGVVSTALGAAAATGAPTALLIGDLSFYHDLNGLLAARRHGLSCNIVLVHNDGGGIFSFLPQARFPEHFEPLFGTPTGLDFRGAAEMHGGRFEQPRTWDEFRESVRAGFERGGLRVTEVRTDRAENVRLHEAAWAACLPLPDWQTGARRAARRALQGSADPLQAPAR